MSSISNQNSCLWWFRVAEDGMELRSLSKKPKFQPEPIARTHTHQIICRTGHIEHYYHVGNQNDVLTKYACSFITHILLFISNTFLNMSLLYSHL